KTNVCKVTAEYLNALRRAAGLSIHSDDGLKHVSAVETSREYLETLRRAAGLRIDPETAVTICPYTDLADPYGDFPDRDRGYECIGAECFARAPDSDVWILFEHLPEETVNALQRRRSRSEEWDGIDFE